MMTTRISVTGISPFRAAVKEDSTIIMKIVKPVCIGMVLGVLVGLCRQTYITAAGGISLPGIAIGILCFVLLQKFKLSVPKVIGIAAVLGLVCFGVF